MADWVTISSLATAGGTLVLAIATFSSVRSANRSARVAELSMLTGMRPVLTPSREDDVTQHVRFGDGQVVAVPGHGGSAVVRDGSALLALSVRNGGSGLAVIHGWRARIRGDPDAAPSLDEFRRQQVDIYIPAGDAGYWLGALRDPGEAGHEEVRAAIGAGEAVQIDLLYGDHEGGQRTIVRFIVSEWPEDEDGRPPTGRRATVVRYFNVDLPNPR